MAAIRNDKQIQSIIKANIVGKYAAGNGLYLRICSDKSCVSLWMVRYTFAGRRRELIIGNYGKREGELTFAQATSKTLELKANIKNGIDPSAEKKRLQNSVIKIVNQLAKDWLDNDIKKRLKHPQIPERIYTKEIAPSIGELPLQHVTPLDIRAIIDGIVKSDRPSIANDTLMYCKQLFRHAIGLNLLTHNPADAFTVRHAGGVEKSRSRTLTLKELETVFQVLRENSNQFNRDNYLAVSLLLLTGVRKGELIAAKWEEFDAQEMVWNLPEERSKTGVAITIPLSPLAMDLLRELQIRAAGSDYILPNRRESKRRYYISDDTLNHALAHLFGLKRDKENLFAVHGIEHFTIHDLRRTMRSLLADLGVQGHIAERCLNHKLKGVEGIYDRYDYLNERKDAHTRLAKKLEPIIQPEKQMRF